jgi:rod shape-determining protein MreD
MIKKLLIFIPLFYFLALFQTSFLVNFKLFGLVPNLVLIAVVLINIFEKPRDYSGLGAGFAAGFFLDVFSQSFFGFHVLILFSLSLFIKVILKKYVWASLG